MLKNILKLLSLILSIMVINGCSNSESSEKFILIECKSDKKEGSQFFNSALEILPMTDELLNKINESIRKETKNDMTEEDKKEMPNYSDKGFSKSELPIYATIQNIKLFDKQSSIKDLCISDMLFYGEIPFDKLSENEIKFTPISENCEYVFFINLNTKDEDLSLLQKNETGTSPFVSTCRIK
jgi:uncharacterized protein YnzC (UPF0291/DUF896 family)